MNKERDRNHISANQQEEDNRVGFKMENGKLNVYLLQRTIRTMVGIG